MFEELIKLSSTQGVWAVLSCALILYILRTQENRDLKQEEREKNYQEIIKQLSEKLNIIDSINLNIQEIKTKFN